MKLKKLMLTGVLVCGLIFAGCGGKSESAKVTKEKSPEVQAAWDDILGEESSEQEDDESEVDDDADDENEIRQEADSLTDGKRSRKCWLLKMCIRPFFPGA